MTWLTVVAVLLAAVAVPLVAWWAWGQGWLAHRRYLETKGSWLELPEWARHYKNVEAETIERLRHDLAITRHKAEGVRGLRIVPKPGDPDFREDV